MVLRVPRQFWQRSLTVDSSNVIPSLELLFMVKKQQFEITLQRRGPFVGKLYQMIKLPICEIKRMNLEGTWWTEDINNEHLQLSVFSNTEKKLIF